MRLALVLLVGFVACIIAEDRWERLRESKERGDYRHVSKEHRSHEYREHGNRQHGNEHREGYKPEPRREEYKPEPRREEYKPEPRREEYKPEPRREEYKPEPRREEYKPEPHREEYKPEPRREEYKPEHKSKSHEAYKKSSEEHKNREHHNKREHNVLDNLGAAERRRQNYGLREEKSKSHEHENKSYEKRPSYPYKNPFPIYIGKLIDVQKAGVRGEVYFVNSTTILLKKFNLPPGPPAIVFWLDQYNTLSGLGIHVKSDKYGYNVLGCYEDDDVFVTIPKSKEAPTLLSYHSFGIYCVKTQVNYGYIHW